MSFGAAAPHGPPSAAALPVRVRGAPVKSRHHVRSISANPTPKPVRTSTQVSLYQTKRQHGASRRDLSPKTRCAWPAVNMHAYHNVPEIAQTSHSFPFDSEPRSQSECSAWGAWHIYRRYADRRGNVNSVTAIWCICVFRARSPATELCGGPVPAGRSVPLPTTFRRRYH